MREHKLSRIYLQESLRDEARVKLTKEHAHYLFTVLRKKIGEKIFIFNEKDGEYKAELVSLDKRSAEANLLTKIRAPKKLRSLTLIYSPLKNVKDEFVIQKATELGVTKITPVIFKNTAKPKIKFEKLNLVATEAAEQCERLDVPEIIDLTNFEQTKESLKDSNKIIIFCDETGQGKSFREQTKTVIKKFKNLANMEIVVIIGAEGGFDKTEIDYIYNLENSYGVGLGERILRADTAIITALALTQSYLGDFAFMPEFRSDI